MDVLTLSQWLASGFYELGAFITCAETHDIILGKGGRVTQTKGFITPQAFYLKDFFQDSYLCYEPDQWRRASRSELLKALTNCNDNVEAHSYKNYDEFYAGDFNRLKASFDEELKKVVLISREEFKLEDPLNARVAFFKKSLTFGVGMPYGLWFEDYGVVGSTPELLYHVKEKKLTTFALAGTHRSGMENELLGSSKDRLEHSLVVDDIKEKLSPFCSGINHSLTGTVNFKDLIHLKTDITATINSEEELGSLTSSLSPTAALGGYPKEKALGFLLETDYFKLHPQRYFGSALGVISRDLKQFLVSIRNIQWKKDHFFVESGGGVLPESDLEKELDEISLKRNTIKRHYL